MDYNAERLEWPIIRNRMFQIIRGPDFEEGQRRYREFIGVDPAVITTEPREDEPTQLRTTTGLVPAIREARDLERQLREYPSYIWPSGGWSGAAMPSQNLQVSGESIMDTAYIYFITENSGVRIHRAISIDVNHSAKIGGNEAFITLDPKESAFTNGKHEITKEEWEDRNENLVRYSGASDDQKLIEEMIGRGAGIIDRKISMFEGLVKSNQKLLGQYKALADLNDSEKLKFTKIAKEEEITDEEDEETTRADSAMRIAVISPAVDPADFILNYPEDEIDR